MTLFCVLKTKIKLSSLILFFSNPLQIYFVFPFFFLIFILFYFLTLQYCIGFAIYQTESATGIHVFPILNPPPSCIPIPSLWVVPVHQTQTSSIVHRTWTGYSFHIWYYTCFNAILPNFKLLGDLVQDRWPTVNVFMVRSIMNKHISQID